jgi:hypothetical protein
LTSPPRNRSPTPIPQNNGNRPRRSIAKRVEPTLPGSSSWPAFANDIGTRSNHREFEHHQDAAALDMPSRPLIVARRLPGIASKHSNVGHRSPAPADARGCETVDVRPSAPTTRSGVGCPRAPLRASRRRTRRCARPVRSVRTRSARIRIVKVA